jgi:hypothetical protein
MVMVLTLLVIPQQPAGMLKDVVHCRDGVVRLAMGRAGL